MIEKVKVLRTLKAGDNIWYKGEVIGPPVPDDLLREIRRGWVEIVKESIPPPPVKKVSDKAETTATSSSSSSVRRRKKR